MQRKKSSIWKWLALFTSFVGAMCCLCLGLVFIIGSGSNQTTTAVLSSTATAIVQPQATEDAIVQPTTVIQTQASTLTPIPIVVLLPIVPPNSPSVAPTQPSSGNLRFHFVDVGQGDSTVIQTPDGQVVLIDGGETNTGIVQYFQSLGIKRIDVMIATHPHSDHIGGLVQVLQAIPVTKVITSGIPHTTTTYEHFLDAIFSAKAEYVEVKRGDVISLKGISMRVLSPSSNNSDLNQTSIVLQFAYGSTTFLMMGDSGGEIDTELLSSGESLKATILKVAHHGSSSGTTRAFLNAVKPEIALYSAGINNSYHHPAPSTIAALTAVGATIDGTDKNVTIIIYVSPTSYTVHANKSNTQSSVPPIVLPGGSGELQIKSITSPVSKGANATLTARTSSGASCSITVYTNSGKSTAAGLSPKSADASGTVSWTWKVGSRTTSGIWPIAVICGGITQETKFEVR